MQELKVVEEVALAEFENFLDAMGIFIDAGSLDAEDLTTFNKQKGRIVRAVCKGNLTFSDEGEAVFTPSHKRSRYKEPITFRERTGASILASDNKKKNQDVAKSYAVMADMAGVPSGAFAGLAGEDIKVCEAIFALLMD